MREKILKYALQNAVFYNGKANPSALLGKILGAEPELRGQAAQVRKEIEIVVKEVNGLSLEEQKARLEKMAPGMLVKEEKKPQEGLPPLAGAVEGKVVTRFAPSPTGPLNIAHLLRPVMMNYLYAEKYKGKFLLRFEDTDPARIKKEYYDMIREDLENAGVKPDHVIIQSSRMAFYLERGEELVRGGHAYMCTCDAEVFKELKLKKQNCPCQDRPPEENLKMWHDAVKGHFKEGQITTRLKNNMKDPNPVLRDPALFRVMDREHPLVGNKYKYWPLYNFANCVDDHDYHVSHVFRGKEHEHNTAVQKLIYQALKWEPPITINFGMIYQPGEKVHTRDIKEWIQDGKVSGWDDPSLKTIRTLLRRGYTKEAFREYAMQCSLTKHDIIMNWETFDSMNKKVIDHISDRYRAVEEPVELDVNHLFREGISIKSITIPVHPDKKETREIEMCGKVLISGDDFSKYKGEYVRLMDLASVVLDRVPQPIEDESVLDSDLQKLQWVSAPGVHATIVMPDKKIKIVAEAAIKHMKPGTRVQFIRLGFCILDKANPPVFMFTHK